VEEVERLDERGRELVAMGEGVGGAAKEYVDVNPDTTIGLSCTKTYARIWSWSSVGNFVI